MTESHLRALAEKKAGEHSEDVSGIAPPPDVRNIAEHLYVRTRVQSRESYQAGAELFLKPLLLAMECLEKIQCCKLPSRLEGCGNEKRIRIALAEIEKMLGEK